MHLFRYRVKQSTRWKHNNSFLSVFSYWLALTLVLQWPVSNGRSEYLNVITLLGKTNRCHCTRQIGIITRRKRRSVAGKFFAFFFARSTLCYWLNLYCFLIQSRDSSVGIALGYGWTIGVLGFDSRRGLGIFLFTTASRTALGPTQPPIQWEPGALPWR
jgi:hypothetical protein